MSRQRQEHRDFLNRYYGLSRRFYDLTRKYYLFGRDRLLDDLLREGWERLVEIGPGTGRNLRYLHQRRPNAAYGGVEASDEMLAHAAQKCPWARLRHGFAEDTDYTSLLGGRPDRIMFSYCLSMVQDRPAAIRSARASLAPDGQLVVVDFADLAGLPRPFASALRKWLETFHVDPLDTDELIALGASLEFGPGHYFVIARFAPMIDADR